MASFTALSFLLLTVLWPVALASLNLRVVASILMFVVLLFVWHYNSSDLISFWGGLTTICDLVRRGHPRLWPVLMGPILGIVYVLASLFMLIGVARGRETAQLLWAALVGRFAQSGQP